MALATIGSRPVQNDHHTYAIDCIILEQPSRRVMYLW